MPSGAAQRCQMDMSPLTCCELCCVANVFVIFLPTHKTLFRPVCQKQSAAVFRNLLAWLCIWGRQSEPLVARGSTRKTAMNSKSIHPPSETAVTGLSPNTPLCYNGAE